MPSSSLSDTHEQYSSHLVNIIRSIFSLILDRPEHNLDMDKSFFEQGATSLQALQVVALLKQEISPNIDTKFFLQHLSIHDLAHAIEKTSLIVNGSII